ncbi:MAG: exodeoxyribonuclease III [Nodosilinea sp. WJT8-NPBG4]|jgi:exodeoxyribonuclease-3|nr:exodeoxyribonuclease III [Nodosilinea sp. WJT8-NPBG4]
MKVATWNVNSIRSRLDHATQWLQTNPVDVLCLQETKVVNETFPTAAFSELGYIAYIHGQKSYNGVALLSRQLLEKVQYGFASVLGEDRVGDLDDQKRVIAGLWNDIYIVNLYVPNGSSIGSEKYEYKLRWLACLKEYLATLLTEYPNLNVCGDFNIALEDKDIYNSVGKEKHIMSSPTERAALMEVMAVGLKDGFRLFNGEGGHFSWWDYRTAAFQRNMGWRIDHHYLSAGLSDRALSCTIDLEPRRWEKPSDHTPVTMEYA